MANYKKLYYRLFGDIVDLTEELELKLKHTHETEAKSIIQSQIDSLIKLQLDAEESFIS